MNGEASEYEVHIHRWNNHGARISSNRPSNALFMMLDEPKYKRQALEIMDSEFTHGRDSFESSLAKALKVLRQTIQSSIPKVRT